MKIKYFFIFLTLMLPGLAFSQITIDQSDFLSIYTIGGTSTSIADTLIESVDIGQSGGDNNWNFTNLTAHEIVELTYLDPSTTPYADSFEVANIVSYFEGMFDIGGGSSAESETWAYYDSDDGVNYGKVSKTTLTDDSTETVSENFTFHYPPFIKYDFPITFDKMWSFKDSTKSSTYTNDTLNISNISTTTYNIHVDAWGTMTMPGGKSVDALRLREQDITTTYYFGIPVSSGTSVTYYFLAKSGESLSVLAQQEDPPTSGIISGLASWQNDNATGIEEYGTNHNKFTLLQNYPNPFTKSTQIQYSIKEPTFVKLSVFNVRGNEVKTLVNEFQSMGNYKSHFDGSNFPGGTYFVRLTAGDSSQVKRMSFVK